MAVDGTPGPKGRPGFLAEGAPEDWVDLQAVGDYAELVGNRKALTRAQRLALTGNAKWEGLTVQETDGDYNVFTYLGGAWRFVSSPEKKAAGLDYIGAGVYGNDGAMLISRKNGTVTLDLAISKAYAFSDGDQPGRFPVGFRPAKNIRGAGQFAGAGTPTLGFFSIAASDGLVTLSGAPGAHTLFFAALPFDVPVPT